MKKNILYITWDGKDTTYLESLFLPIFAELKKKGFCFSVVQFSWKEQKDYLKLKEECNRNSIIYHHISIIRRPINFGALITIIMSTKKIIEIIKREKIDLIMPRSILPGLSALLIKKKTKLPILFDADGLPLDERIDFTNLKASGFNYRLQRDIELRLLFESQSIIVRSTKAIDILKNRVGSRKNQCHYVSTNNGRSNEYFNLGNQEIIKSIRAELEIAQHEPLIVYAGSIGQQYCINEMLDIFYNIKELISTATLLILTGNQELAEKSIKENNSSKSIIIKNSSHHKIGQYLAAADLGLAIRKPTFSMQGVSPIKIGEYLLCGLPVIASHKIGDTEDILKNQDFCFLLKEHNDNTYKACAKWFHSIFTKKRYSYRSMSNELGKKYFSLENTANHYREAINYALER